METVHPLIIIGGGAAGLYAGILARQKNIPCLMLEKNSRLGRKLALTGGGRGNFTNKHFTLEYLDNQKVNAITSYPHANKTLRAILSTCSCQDIVSFFEELGISSIEEDFGRILPKSLNAEDIVKKMSEKYNNLSGIVHYNQEVIEIRQTPDECGYILKTDKDQSYFASNILLTIGGNAYPKTGSSGDSHRILKGFPIKQRPYQKAMLPLSVEENLPSLWQGITLEYAAFAYLMNFNKRRYKIKRTGPLLFQRAGLSGPLALSCTGDLYDDRYEKDSLKMSFLNPIQQQELAKILIEKNNIYIKREIRTLIREFLPQAISEELWKQFYEANSLDYNLQLANLSKPLGESLIAFLQAYPLNPASMPLQDGMISRGGIEQSEINFRTMELKKSPGLYVAGEVIDFDFISGGYNLSFAFSTANTAINTISAKYFNQL